MEVYDSLTTEIFNGRNFHPEFDTLLYKELNLLANMILQLVYYGNKTANHIYFSPFFIDLINKIDQRIIGNSDLKLIVNSGHDTTLMALLNFLNFTDFHCQY